MKLKFKLKERINEYLDLKEIGAPDPNYLGEVSDAIADEVMEFLMELADDPADDFINESRQLDEKFTSYYMMVNHFNRHCFGDPSKWHKDRASHREGVYYDFFYMKDYTNYEAKITRKCADPDFVVDSLCNTPDVINAFKLLEQGNVVIEFSRSCGIANSQGVVSLYMIAFADEVTTNYPSEHTVSLCVKSKAGSTISLYPLALSYIKHKFHHILKSYVRDKKVAKLYKENV